MADKKKPKGWGKFDALAKRVVVIPKATTKPAQENAERTSNPPKK